MNKEKPKDYKKIFKIIQKNISLKEYNKWIESHKSNLKSKEDYYLVYSGIRIGLGLREQIDYEELQKKLPMSEAEHDYYMNL